MTKVFRERFFWFRSDSRKSKTCGERRRTIQNRKLVGLVAIVIAFVLCGGAQAQQQGKVPKIGFLGVRPDAANYSAKSILLELQKLGYVEGKNFTFETSITGELGGKLLELLKESVPRLSSVAMVSSGGDANKLFLKETEPAARALGLKLIHQVVRTPEDFDSAFDAINKQRINGLLSRLGPGFMVGQHKRFVELAIKNRLPAISPDRDWVESGGLMFYGTDQTARLRRVAVYIDKILKGTKPADLPIEAPMKFEFVINLKTAKQMGLKIPPAVLGRADRVIK